MGMARRFPTKEQRDPFRFLSRLSYALSELVLIILLYIHAFLSYFVHKFACYRKLPTPCLLCASLGRRRSPYLDKELICNAHKLEVSSLAYCRAHHKLVDAQEMCNGCLNANFLCKKLYGKSKRHCSCCSVQFKNRPYAHSLIQRKNIKEPNHMQNRSRALSIDHRFDRFSEEDEVKEELLSRCLQAGSTANLPNHLIQDNSDKIVQEKLVHRSSIETGVNVSDSHTAMGIGHGLEEINWGQVEVKPSIPISSEIAVEQVRIEALITKLNVPDNIGFASTGESIKSLNSNDLGMRSSQLMHEMLKVPLPSTASSEFTTGRESSKVPEDIKTRLSQLSSGQWLEVPWNEIASSPRTNLQIDDQSKLSDASSSNGFLNLKKFCTDESLDGSLVSEIEGESAMDRLNRQIDMDRKNMSILYKELEEERNASAIAANQAMAMINRLQEEKAAMQMEALQYLRMMEEQTEYDQEALQKLNDLLADRDKEIQDLEALIESYRKQFGGEASRALESAFECEEREYTEYTPVSTPRFVRSRGHEVGKTLVRNTVLDFEDEKVYISECLRRLERKLRLFANNEDSLSGKISELEDNYSVENGEINDDKKNSEKPSTPSFRAISFSIRQALKESTLQSISYNDRQFQMGGKKMDTIALGNEISQLNVRLEALEEDRNFLEHAVSSLREGSNGIQFIQEIACHLRELRKIGITRQENIVS